MYGITGGTFGRLFKEENTSGNASYDGMSTKLESISRQGQ